jgi:hypothetical protein
MTTVTYYGSEASKCTVSVYADRKNGTAAKGELVHSIRERNFKEWQQSDDRNKYFDLTWRLLVSGFLIYLFVVVRNLKSKKP